MGLKPHDVVRQVCKTVNDVLDYQKGKIKIEDIFTFEGCDQHQYETKDIVSKTIENVKKSKK